MCTVLIKLFHVVRIKVNIRVDKIQLNIIIQNQGSHNDMWHWLIFISMPCVISNIHCKGG